MLEGKIGAVRALVRPLKLAFAVSETGPDASAGDYFTALELGTALQARYGWQIEYRTKGDDWYDMTGIDLLVAMVENYELPAIHHAAPELITIAWARNWCERWCEQPWIADYSLLLASSLRITEYMSRRTGKLTRLLRIATNPARFNTDQRSATPALDYVFTGNFWQVQRDIVAALPAAPKQLRGAIYGKHWEQVPDLAHLIRSFVPYGQIHEVYRQAAIVIDDANHVTKEWGAANSRVFDALAAGCLVITNSKSVSDEVFRGCLPVYRDPADLASLLARYLANPEERGRLVDQLRSMVLKKHNYSRRAFEFGIHLQSVGFRAISLAEINRVR